MFEREDKELDRLRERHRKALEVLRKLEWSGKSCLDGKACCPICYGREHIPDCALAKALEDPLTQPSSSA